MKLARLHDGPEIFHTLQGEGVSAGTPAVFVRASRCNLHCRWCDTAYTWRFEGSPFPHDRDPTYDRDDVTLDLTPEELVPHITRHPARLVVLTGGEPLLQQDAWLELIHLLRRHDPFYRFEVETNGTLIPSDTFAAAIDQFNVSPKLANSGMDAKTRLVPKALDWFAASPKSWFKFVARHPDELHEIDALVQSHEIPESRVLIMPEGRTAADLDRHALALANACLQRGWRLTDRLHVRLWGDQRGV